MYQFLPLLIFIIYCIIIYIATIFFSVLLDILFKKNHNDKNKYFETFLIWFFIVLYIYLFKELLIYFHDNILFNKFIKTYFYDIQS